MLCAAAKSNTPCAWSPCSWVTSMPSMSRGARPSRASRRSESVRLRPQSSSTRVSEARSPASTTRQFPRLPLASDAKRSKTLFQLFVEQHEDALRGGRGLGAALLVQDVHRASLVFRLHLHAVLLGLHLGVARAEEAREQALLVVLLRHLALGIGVAYEVDPVLAVAILDGKADAVEREAHAPPGAVERLVHLQRLRAVARLHELGAVGGRPGGRGELGALFARAQAHHQPAQELGLEPGIGRARLPARLALVALLRVLHRVHLLHAAMADVDLRAFARGGALRARTELVALGARIDAVGEAAEQAADEVLRQVGAVLGPVGFHDADLRRFLLDQEATF